MIEPSPQPTWDAYLQTSLNTRQKWIPIMFMPYLFRFSVTCNSTQFLHLLQWLIQDNLIRMELGTLVCWMWEDNQFFYPTSAPKPQCGQADNYSCGSQSVVSGLKVATAAAAGNSLEMQIIRTYHSSNESVICFQQALQEVLKFEIHWFTEIYRESKSLNYTSGLPQLCKQINTLSFC